MLPPASDGRDAPPPRPTRDDPDGSAHRGESDVLSGLVRLVTERAARLRGPGAPGPAAMEGLREAVDALGHVLDAFELLRRSPAPIDESADPGSPEVAAPRPEAASSTEEEPAGPEPRVRRAEDETAPKGPRLAADSDARSTHRPHRSGRSEAGPEAAGGVDANHRYPAFRDRATGLLSREGFEWIASGELKRCARHGRVFTMLLVRSGAVGDEFLERTAEVVRRALRGSDVAGREGERAVVVALPETAQREARAVGERLVGALDAAGVWSREGRIGMAAYPTHGETVWSLLEMARSKLSLPAGNVPRGEGDGGYRSG